MSATRRRDSLFGPGGGYSLAFWMVFFALVAARLLALGVGENNARGTLRPRVPRAPGCNRE